MGETDIMNINSDITDINLEDLSWGTVEKPTEKEEQPNPFNAGARRRKVELCEIPEKTIYRRCYGEINLLEKTGIKEFENGHSYHFITGGDVDSLSFLKLVLLHQKLDYCLFSTWCMAADDILQFRKWIEEGIIKKCDAYVGEIFPNSYAGEWFMLNKMMIETGCGRVVCFKNHSKIFAGVGEKFAFVIESSANINTNPRTEQGVITISRDLFEFYKHYFDGIK
jgi:hypothetical protein